MADAWWAAIEPLVDPWRQSYPRWADRWPSSPGDALDDPDRDDWPNGFEYAAGTHPFDPTSRPTHDTHPEAAHLAVPFDPIRARENLALQAGPPNRADTHPVEALSAYLVPCAPCGGWALPLEPWLEAGPAFFRWLWREKESLRGLNFFQESRHEAEKVSETLGTSGS